MKSKALICPQCPCQQTIKKQKSFTLSNTSPLKRQLTPNSQQKSTDYQQWKRKLNDEPTNQSSQFILSEYQLRIDSLLKQIFQQEEEIQSLQGKLVDQEKYFNEVTKRLHQNNQKQQEEIQRLKQRSKESVFEEQQNNSQMTFQVQELNEINQAEREKNQQLILKLSEYENQIRSLQQELKLINKRFQDLEVDRNNLVETEQKMRDQLAEQLQKIYNEQSEYLQEKVKGVEQENVELKRQVMELEVDRRQESRFSPQRESTEMNSRILQKQQEYIDKQDYHINQLLSELEVWRQKVDEIEKQKAIELQLKDKQYQPMIKQLQIHNTQLMVGEQQKSQNLKLILDQKILECETLQQQKNELAIRMNDMTLVQQKLVSDLEYYKRAFPTFPVNSSMDYAYRLDLELQNLRNLYEQKQKELDMLQQRH